MFREKRKVRFYNSDPTLLEWLEENLEKSKAHTTGRRFEHKKMHEKSIEKHSGDTSVTPQLPALKIFDARFSTKCATKRATKCATKSA